MAIKLNISSTSPKICLKFTLTLVGLRNPKFPPKFKAVDIVFFSADYASLGCI